MYHSTTYRTRASPCCFAPERQQFSPSTQSSPKAQSQSILSLKWIIRATAFTTFLLIWLIIKQSQIFLHSSSSILLQPSPPPQSNSHTTRGIVVHNNKSETSSISNIRQASRLQLRLDWTNLQPMSELTRRMVSHQSNCSAPMGTFRYRNRFGMGSDLHVWGQALCNGMQRGLRLRTVGNWTWMDEHHCRKSIGSPMRCYFEASELNCPGDAEEARSSNDFEPSNALSRSNGVVTDQCQAVYQGMDRSQVRRSAMEFLFAHVSPRVVDEAQRQLNTVFQGLQRVPPNLITVHIRWGDKAREMKLVKMHEYIQAIQNILQLRQPEAAAPGDIGMDEANIYLATEDPEAVQQFRNGMPSSWNLYVDQAFTELLPYRVAEYNGSPKMSKALYGRAGLVTLGSLLVAMEANDFVLTTASNWSRVMNELRQSILDPRCDYCTRMIDLRKVRNEW